MVPAGIRLNAIRLSTIPQKQFIIIIKYTDSFITVGKATECINWVTQNATEKFPVGTKIWLSKVTWSCWSSKNTNLAACNFYVWVTLIFILNGPSFILEISSFILLYCVHFTTTYLAEPIYVLTWKKEFLKTACQLTYLSYYPEV